jgi:hypothetical protein
MGVDNYYLDILNIDLNPFWRSPREHNSVAPVFSINPSLGKLCAFPDLNITVPRQVKKLQIEKFPQRTIKELRRKMNVGPDISDEEFLLRYGLEVDEVDAMLAAGLIKISYP